MRFHKIGTSGKYRVCKLETDFGSATFGTYSCAQSIQKYFLMGYTKREVLKLLLKYPNGVFWTSNYCNDEIYKEDAECEIKVPSDDQEIRTSYY